MLTWPLAYTSLFLAYLGKVLQYLPTFCHCNYFLVDINPLTKISYTVHKFDFKAVFNLFKYVAFIKRIPGNPTKKVLFQSAPIMGWQQSPNFASAWSPCHMQPWRKLQVAKPAHYTVIFHFCSIFVAANKQHCICLWHMMF